MYRREVRKNREMVQNKKAEVNMFWLACMIQKLAKHRAIDCSDTDFHNQYILSKDLKLLGLILLTTDGKSCSSNM